MCYTKVVTKEKGNCSVTDKRYNIYKEDIKMAVVKLTTDNFEQEVLQACLLYTSPSPRDLSTSRMPSSA